MSNLNAIPISIGITGHRDFIQTETHSNLLKAFFKKLLEDYKDSPIVLYTPLAEGADRFVANIFLSFKEDYKSRIKLYVPLPNKKDNYINEFNNSSKEEFNNLFSKADKTFSVQNYHDNKNEYLNVGKFIVDSSNILIAIWNGLDNGKVGGTSDIVNYKKNGTFNKSEVGDKLITKDSFIHLPCKRISKNNDKLLELPTDLYASIESNHKLKASLNKINSINKRNSKIHNDEVKTSISSFYPNNEILNKEVFNLLSLFTLFDKSAKKTQRKDKISIKSLFISGGLILICFEIYKHINFNMYFLYLSIVLIIISYFGYLITKKLKLHQLYLEKRTLAESLRVSFFWTLANIQEKSSEHILSIHKSDFNWINNLLKSINGITYNESNESNDFKEIKNLWLVEQVNYFDSKINNIENKVNLYNNLARIFFAIAFLLMISILFLNNFYEEHHYLHPLIVIIGSSFGIFALLKAFIERLGFEQIINQYELSKSLFTSAVKKIDEIEKSNQSETQKKENIKKVFIIVGKESLIEVGNWYSIYKDKGAELEGIG